MIARLLPPGFDRYRRHQLAVELTGAGLLAGATGSWQLVGLVGGIALPAVRATWVNWLRRGPGLLPVLIATALVATWSARAAAAVLVVAFGFGIARCLRSTARQASGPSGPSALSLHGRVPLD